MASRSERRLAEAAVVRRVASFYAVSRSAAFAECRKSGRAFLCDWEVETGRRTEKSNNCEERGRASARRRGRSWSIRLYDMREWFC